MTLQDAMDADECFFTGTAAEVIAMQGCKGRLALSRTMLAIALASAFIQDPRVVFLAVASELPWSTMLGPFRWTLQFVR